MSQTKSFLEDGDRYHFDFGECSIANGFAQMDTEQDAWYYGNWANPFTLQLVAYVEGDIYRTTCSDVAGFVYEVKEFARWSEQDAGYKFLGIDAGFRDDLKKRFEEIGLGELLH